MADSPNHPLATVAAGCFWGVQAKFDRLVGVHSTVVGYTGGITAHPTYEQVCRGDTQHAEAIEIEFDPTVINYQSLLEYFFANHNPTTPNQQGPDYGSQYRSAIFYHNPQQLRTAQKVIAELTKKKHFKAPIVTQLAQATDFYRAEDYHQHYYLKQQRD